MIGHEAQPEINFSTKEEVFAAASALAGKLLLNQPTVLLRGATTEKEISKEFCKKIITLIEESISRYYKRDFSREYFLVQPHLKTRPLLKVLSSRLSQPPCPSLGPTDMSLKTDMSQDMFEFVSHRRLRAVVSLFQGLDVSCTDIYNLNSRMQGEAKKKYFQETEEEEKDNWREEYFLNTYPQVYIDTEEDYLLGTFSQVYIVSVLKGLDTLKTLKKNVENEKHYASLYDFKLYCVEPHIPGRWRLMCQLC